MTLPFLTTPYERWAPVLGRVLFAAMFLYAAVGHLPGSATFAMQAAAVTAVGIPFPQVAITLAFILEVGASLAMIVGWNTRFAAFLLMLYTVLLTLLFHTSFADAMAVGFFFNHLALIGGLLYISVYGAQHAAVATCPLPTELTKKV